MSMFDVLLVDFGLVVRMTQIYTGEAGYTSDPALYPLLFTSTVVGTRLHDGW
jgi:hypothetical protein